MVRLGRNDPMIEEIDLKRISSQVEDIEVKEIIFSMNPWKAPGSDGFHVGFLPERVR